MRSRRAVSSEQYISSDMSNGGTTKDYAQFGASLQQVDRHSNRKKIKSHILVIPYWVVYVSLFLTDI